MKLKEWFSKRGAPQRIIKAVRYIVECAFGLYVVFAHLSFTKYAVDGWFEANKSNPSVAPGWWIMVYFSLVLFVGVVFMVKGIWGFLHQLLLLLKVKADKLDVQNNK